MKYDELTKMEEIALKTFKELWNERDTSPININIEGKGICICKENGKWVSFTYVRGEKAFVRKYDNLNDVVEHFFSLLEKDNENYCISKYPEVLKDNLENKRKPGKNYVPYEKLTSEEKTLLDAFIKLLKEKNEYNLHVVYPTEDKVDKYNERIQFYKLGNKWVSYILERNQKTDFQEYNELYPICLEIIERLEKSEYYLDVFPILAGEIKNYYGKKKTKKIEKNVARKNGKYECIAE